MSAEPGLLVGVCGIRGMVGEARTPGTTLALASALGGRPASLVAPFHAQEVLMAGESITALGLSEMIVDVLFQDRPFGRSRHRQQVEHELGDGTGGVQIVGLNVSGDRLNADVELFSRTGLGQAA